MYSRSSTLDAIKTVLTAKLKECQALTGRKLTARSIGALMPKTIQVNARQISTRVIGWYPYANVVQFVINPGANLGIDGTILKVSICGVES
jgi:hypothetical protein